MRYYKRNIKIIDEAFENIFDSSLIDYSNDFEKSDKNYKLKVSVENELERRLELMNCMLGQYSKIDKWWGDMKIKDEEVEIPINGDAFFSLPEYRFKYEPTLKKYFKDNNLCFDSLPSHIKFEKTFKPLETPGALRFFASYLNLKSLEGFPTTYESNGGYLYVDYSHNKLSNIPDLYFINNSGQVIIDLSYNRLVDEDLKKLHLGDAKLGEIKLQGNNLLSSEALIEFEKRYGRRFKITFPKSMKDARYEIASKVIDHNYIKQVQPIIDKELENFYDEEAPLWALSQTEVDAIIKLIKPFVKTEFIKIGKQQGYVKSIKFVSNHSKIVNPEKFAQYSGLISKTPKYDYGLCLTTNLDSNPMTNDAKTKYSGMGLEEFINFFVDKYSSGRI